MNIIQLFSYLEKDVRVFMRDGEPWWVLKDICEILGIGSVSRTAERLEEDQKGMSQTHTLGGNQEMIIVNEAGLYEVVIRSDKPEAKAFRRWITREVLPAIRKSGGYGLQETRVEIQKAKLLNEMSKNPVFDEEKKLQLAEKAAALIAK